MSKLFKKMVKGNPGSSIGNISSQGSESVTGLRVPRPGDAAPDSGATVAGAATGRNGPPKNPKKKLGGVRSVLG